MHFNNVFNICGDGIEGNTFKPRIHLVSVLTVFISESLKPLSLEKKEFISVFHRIVYSSCSFYVVTVTLVDIITQKTLERNNSVWISLHTCHLTPLLNVLIFLHFCSDGFLEKHFLLPFFLLLEIRNLCTFVVLPWGIFYNFESSYGALKLVWEINLWEMVPYLADGNSFISLLFLMYIAGSSQTFLVTFQRVVFHM